MKLMELKKMTKGQAHDLIKSLPEEDANLKQALDTLDSFYKDNIKSAELVINDLLSAPRMQNTSESVLKAYTALITAKQTLRGMAITGEQRGDLLFSVIAESKLNNPLIKSWTDKKKAKADPGNPLGHTATAEELEDLIKNHYHLLKTYETNKAIEKAKDGSDTGKEGKDPKKQEKKQEDKQAQKRSGNPTWPGGFSGQRSGDGQRQGPGPHQGQSVKPKHCVGCKKDGHTLLECFRFTSMKTGAERRKLLDDYKISICRNCLKGPHSTKECRQQPGCHCGLRHHAML